MSTAVEDRPVQHLVGMSGHRSGLHDVPRAEGVFLQNLRTSLPLLLADIIGVTVAVGLAICLDAATGAQFQLTNIVPLMVGLWPAFAVSNYLFGLYPGVGLKPATEFRLIASATTVVIVALTTSSLVLGGRAQLTLPAFALFWVAAIGVISALRSTTRLTCARFDWWSQPVLIVGRHDSNCVIADALKRERHSGLRLVGVVSPPASQVDGEAQREPTYADSELRHLTKELSVHRAIVSSDAPNLNDLCAPGAGFPHLHVVSTEGEREIPTLWSSVGECAGLPELQLRDSLLIPTMRLIKRIVDVAVIVAFAPLLLPVFASLGLLVKLSSKGPIFYSQQRLGLRGRHFQVWKFRTMVINADQVLQTYLDRSPSLRSEWARDHKLKNDPRVTAIGKFLRKTSLDELPQLWNVVCGDMSLVGPRPIVDAEIEKYGSVYELYKLVRPGITGIWQVSGRNNTSYEERLQYDRYYVRNWDPWLDLFILLRTVKTVLLREGAY